ncbi:MAG: hypothetical protein KGL39_39990 [Patescibacteria group bacterium]|nr:hypothetical protein [Patescibacteria group bacterium]
MTVAWSKAAIRPMFSLGDAVIALDKHGRKMGHGVVRGCSRMSPPVYDVLMATGEMATVLHTYLRQG